MNEKTNVHQNIETLFEQLEKFLKTETVVGEPITIGNISIVPLITVSFGCGTGSGSGSDSNKGESGTGSGLGAGAKISPDAVLVVKGEDVSILPIKGKMNLEKLIEKVPNLLEHIDFKKSCCHEEEEVVTD